MLVDFEEGAAGVFGVELHVDEGGALEFVGEAYAELVDVRAAGADAPPPRRVKMRTDPWLS